MMSENKILDFSRLTEEGAVLNINKPLTWTSFDVVNKVRYRLSKHLGVKKIKVGHAGTLDPLADGVLILCVGKATKQIERIQSEEKEYLAEICFGATTPSFDMELPVDKEYPVEHITKEGLEEALKQFVGDILQRPPDFSAVKVNGKRAYDMARKGECPAIEAKQVSVGELEIIAWHLPYLTLRVRCSKGTYIRALARDLGRAMDSGAYLTKLTRTRVGSFSVDKAISIEEFEKFIEQEHQ